MMGNNRQQKGSESSRQHAAHAADQIQQIKLAIITVSDSRTPETDTNGQYLQQQAESMQIEVVFYQVIADDPRQVDDSLILAAEKADIILFNGGTGISGRDTTYDALVKRIEKPLPGFGELFRMLSYEQIGGAAMLSRATAGVYQGRIVFSVPGSHAAVKLA